MSIELATKIFQQIGAIKHLRSFEFLKAIEENQDADQWSRITYAKWRDTYGLHAFILNECTRECQELGFIEVGRENKGGLTTDGGKGTRRIYRLTLDKVNNVTPTAEPKKEIIEPENKPEPIIPEKVEQKRSNPLPATKFSKGKKVAEKPKQEKKPVPAKKAVAKPVKKETPKSKAPVKKAPVKKVAKKK